MTTEELKQAIEQRTGIPASLLTGETAEENIARAKALLALKKEREAERPKTAAEQFSAWLNQGAADPGADALAEIEETVKAGDYPPVKDSGEVTGLPDPRPARELFAEWLGSKIAFNPFEY